MADVRRSKSTKKHQWPFTKWRVCKQKSKLNPDDDPYDQLPDSNEQQNTASARATLNASCPEIDTSALGDSGGTNTTNTLDTAAALQVTNSSFNTDDETRSLSDIHQQFANSARNETEQRNSWPESVGESPPELPERRRRDTRERPSQINSAFRHDSDDGQFNRRNSEYIHLPNQLTAALAVKNGYINVEKDYPHLEREKSPSLPNEYTVWQAGMPVPCGMNAPSIPYATENLPSAHGQRRNRYGYLTNYTTTNYRMNYITNSLSTLHQPPAILQNFIDNFSKQRHFGAVHVHSDGGIFPIYDIETNRDILTVFIAENSVDEKTALFFASSQNCEDFPTSVPYQYLRSDVIHMLPHGKTFAQPILVRIPLYDVADELDMANLCVMYSDSDSGVKAPVWKILQNNSRISATNEQYQHPVWFFREGYLYLYVTHFCMFVVVDNRSGEAKTYKPLKVSLSLEYKSPLRVIGAVVSFDTQNKEASQTCDEDEECFMFCENNENVQVELETEDHWKMLGRGLKKQEVSYVQLCNIDNIAQKPKIKYNLQYSSDKDKSGDMGDVGVTMTIKIYQHNGDIPAFIEKVFTLNEITRSSRPAVEGRAESCSGQVFSSLSTDAADTGVASYNPSIQKLRSEAQEHSEPSERLSTAAIPYIKETYLSQSYNVMTRKGILVPDARVQSEIAQILDPTNGWEPIAIELKIRVASLLSAESPTKCLLHAYSLEGNKCNWTEFSDKLRRHNFNKAADILCDWHSQQTFPKERQ